MVACHLKQIGKVKKVDKWVPHELTTDQRKKIIVLKCHLLLFYTTTMNHFSIGLWHAMKSGFYTTTSNDELSGWTKNKLQSTSQSQTPKKWSWSLFCGLLPIQSTTAFWTPAKPLYLRSMLSKSMRCTETCQENGRSSSLWQHQLRVAQPTLQNRTTKFWLIHRTHLTTCQPTTTPLTILTTFCRGKYFHHQQEAENAFQEFLEFWSTDFYATWINYFLLAKICWL